ncbi:hypothetical protein EVAR_47034_1 [Eumeta japonica]|uniref:Uncharacterized protein n=1 Tax=Eumeta variegata TaxID=151549 RepID=A0A4C1XJZ6_EUMVA|nr:hypothetical protein EVAR_47034_1 [Eumeta japonica]
MKDNDRPTERLFRGVTLSSPVLYLGFLSIAIHTATDKRKNSTSLMENQMKSRQCNPAACKDAARRIRPAVIKTGVRGTTPGADGRAARL